VLTTPCSSKCRTTEEALIRLQLPPVQRGLRSSAFLVFESRFVPVVEGRTMATTRVLLVDDESLVRRILKQILSSYLEMELVGEAATGYEAISAVEKLQPDIVVMDIRMPGLDGIAAAREIKAKYPHVKIIGLSEYAYGYNTDAMEKAGAVGVYQKSKATEELYTVISKVAAGQNYPSGLMSN